MEVMAQTMPAKMRKVLDFFSFRMLFLSNMLLTSVMTTVAVMNEKYMVESCFLNCISSMGRSIIAIKDRTIQIIENFIMMLDIMNVI